MSTTTATTPDLAPTEVTTRRVAPIPFSRVVSVELRKMFDTRSGFWLMSGIVIAAVIATFAVVFLAPDDQLTFSSFASAIGVPMTILLPIVAILSITSEWSQRTGLTTFTYVPHRGRVIGAKAVCAIGVGVVSMLLAAGIGSLGNLLGAAVNGTSPVWDMSVADFALVILADLLGMTIGFMLGVLLRNSPGAIVGYFVYNFVIPGLSAVLAASQDWWKSAQPWLDFNHAQSALYDGGLTSTQWTQLLVTGLVWVVLPLAVGLRLVLRSEVK